MRHGPELHDALRKTQSAGIKQASSTGNRLSGGDVQQSATRQTQSVHTPESRQSLHGNYALNNGTAGMTSTQQFRCFVLCGSGISSEATPWWFDCNCPRLMAAVDVSYIFIINTSLL